MGKYKRYKNRIEAFLSGEKGQRFFNFAYSIGAAVVIWGALFKILHLPGGNALLSIGMGTEVLMFVLTAFDRPPREYHWEEVFPVLNTKNPEDRPEFKGGNGGGVPGQAGEGGTINVVGGGSVSGTVNLGGIGGVAGPFVGAFFLEMVRSLAVIYAAEMWNIIIGAGLLIVIFFLPRGLYGLLDRVVVRRSVK